MFFNLSANRLKLSAVALAVSLAAFGAFYPRYVGPKVSASASGPTPARTGAPGEANCTSCHSTFPVNSKPGTLQISGLPHNYRPGQQIPLTVTLEQPDGVSFGFQMTGIDAAGRRAGTFTFAGGAQPELQLRQGTVGGNLRDYIEHTVNGIVPTEFGTKSWQFTWTAPARRVGRVSFYSAGNAADSDGSPNGDRIFTTSAATLSGSAVSSFDGDLRSEIAVFRPENGFWYSTNSSDGDMQSVIWGVPGDVPAPGDYDGDGTTDRVVFRPDTGTWYLLNSSADDLVTTFGSLGDVPVPGDYDGDLRSDIAVYRPADGVWWIQQSAGGYANFQWGLPTDLVAQGDYDGDARTDIAVFRPNTGVWYILQSSDGLRIENFGQNGDRPVQGDYDGDGRHDVAIFRPSTGQFWIQGSAGAVSSVTWGDAGDIAVPADFDGDGRTDIAVYRPSNGTWWAIRSSNSSVLVEQFGQPGDIPIPSSYVAPQ